MQMFTANLPDGFIPTWRHLFNRQNRQLQRVSEISLSDQNKFGKLAL